MELENVVFDAQDPSRLGRFWRDLLGGRTLSESAQGFEARLQWQDGPLLDLCFQPVAPRTGAPQRVELQLHATSAEGRDTVARALDGGAREIPSASAGTRRLLDPEGNIFQVLDSSGGSAADGVLAALAVSSADPGRDQEFWRRITGWGTEPASGAATALRHPSGRGPRLALVPEAEPKTEEKTPVHLDVRAAPGQRLEALAGLVQRLGGRELHPRWGTLPWRVFRDPSGNEFCVLPAAPNEP